MENKLDYCKAFKVSVTNKQDNEKDEFVFITIDPELGEDYIRSCAEENNYDVELIEETIDFYVYLFKYYESFLNEQNEEVNENIIARETPLGEEDINDIIGRGQVESVNLIYEPKKR